MDVLRKLLRRHKPTSREIAKERLKLVLAYDRAKMSPQLLQTIKDELIEAISRHVEIDREEVKVTFAHGKRRSRLVADIPLVSTRRWEKAIDNR
jgi:cell division topological specificity factor